MRPSKDDTWLRVALDIAERGTCARRKVGCVLVDRNGDVLATGYNGVARGVAHCTDVPCGGVGFKSGEGLDKCEAIHAEQNALLQCRDVQAISTCYVTTSPCLHCLKMLKNTSCTGIVFIEEYAGSKEARLFWMRGNIGQQDFMISNRRWEQRELKHHPREFKNLLW